MRNAARLALVSLFVVIAACGGDGTGPSDHSPKSIGVVSGNSQSAVVGTAVATAPVVVVKDKSGSAVEGVTVSFAIATGGGSLGATSAVTDASGQASPGSWTLGTATGSNTMTASVAALTPITLTATALAGAPAALVFATAPSATAASGAALAQQPVIQVKDQFGNNTGSAFVSVQAAIASGGGTLGGTTSVVSNASGVVTFTNLSIAGSLGARTLSFTATGLPVLTSGAITVGAGAAASIVANSSTTLSGTVGAAVTPLPSVLVTDASGNPVPGAQVDFAVVTGGGSLTGAAPLTDASGIATVGSWTLGSTVGAQSVTATIGALPAVTFNATAAAGSASRLTITSQPSATAVNAAGFGQQPIVRIEDSFGNLVSSATTTVTAVAQGGTAVLGGTTSVAAVGGIVTFTNLKLTGLTGNYTIAFSGASLTGAVSGAIALAAGPATTVALNAGNNQTAVVGTAVAIAPSVLVTDVSGNPVGGTAVTFAVASGGGSLTGGAASSNASGIATVGSWTLGSGAGANTLTATAASLSGSPVTFTATATPGAGSIFSITTQPSASATNGVALAQQPVIQLRDASNNPVSLAGVVVTASIASGGGTLSGATTATTNGSGTATFSGLTLNGLVGNRTLSFGSAGVTPVTSTTIALAAGAASQLAMVTQPSAAAINGAVLATQPSVRITDQSGNAVAQSGTAVTVAIASGGGSLAGTATVNTDAAGVATFAGLGITGLVGNRTLGFSAGGLTGVTSGTIAISAGAATTLALSAGDAQSAAAGTALPIQPAVFVSDQSGNPVSGVAVTFAVAGGGGSILGGAATTGANGIATAGAWTLGTVAGANSVTATSGSLSGSPLTFTATGVPGAASQLVLVTQPSSNATNGSALAQQPVLQLRDQFGNDVSQAGKVVTATVASGGGTVSGGTTATTDAAGTATFSGLVLNGLVGAKTLGFSASGVTGATSGTVTLAAGPASQLLMVTQPSATAVNGGSFATQPSVRLADAGGNLVLTAGTAVTVAINTGGGSLGGGALSVNTDASGIATYAGLGITGVVGNRTLKFNSSGLTQVVSGTINLTAGPATTLALSAGDNQTATVATAVPVNPEVLVTDQSGNPVSGTSVTFAVASGHGTIAGGSATTGASGLATSGSWTLGDTVGANTLTATSAGLVGSPVTFTATGTAAAASQLTITTQPPATAAVGAALSPQPVLQLRDQFGNAVSQAGVVVTATVFSGGGTLAGGTTATTSASGVATFSGLIVNGTAATSQVLRFTGPSLTAVDANAITLTAGAASQLVLTTQPSSTATNGIPFATQPVLQLRDAGGNNVLQAGVSVAAAVTGAPAGIALGGTSPVVTNASGVASFADLALVGTVGSYTLTFSKSGLTSAVSGTITTAAGAAANVLRMSTASQSGHVGVAVGTLPQVKVVDASGNPVSGVSVTYAVTAGGGSVTGSAPTTDFAGLATVGGWTLGKSVTTNTVSATVGALPIVTFDATATFVVARVAGGGAHSCAITVDGIAYCWGDNTSGAIGDNTSAPAPAPVPVSGSGVYSAIVAGSAHTCAVTGAGAAECWGLNNKGQLGIGSTSISRVPATVSGGHVFTLIGLGSDHSCGILSSGAVDCWGANLSGQLGNGSTSAGAQTTPLQVVASGYSQVSAGVFFTCGAKSTGEGRCWGTNTFGQLGDSTFTLRVSPTLVKGGLTFAEIVTSQTHSCGRTTGGAVYCWGYNGNGRLAQDTLTLPGNQSLVPKLVTGLSNVVQLVAGLGHTCARTASGAVSCWGLNDSGQLGDGTFSNRQVVTSVSLPVGVTGFATISAGSAHTCAVTSAGAAYCWGDNGGGQIGDGSGNDQPSPVLISNP